MGGKGVTKGVRRGRSADHRFFLVFVKKVFNRIDTEAVSELVNEDCIVFGRQGVAQRKPVFQFSDDFLGRDAKKPFFFPFSMDGKVKGPKKLGTFGASYLYPLLLKLGVIQTETKSCII